MISEDNEMQPSYLHNWKQTILELDNPPSAKKVPLVSSFSPLCKYTTLFDCFKETSVIGSDSVFDKF